MISKLLPCHVLGFLVRSIKDIRNSSTLLAKFFEFWWQKSNKVILCQTRDFKRVNRSDLTLGPYLWNYSAILHHCIVVVILHWLIGKDYWTGWIFYLTRKTKSFFKHFIHLYIWKEHFVQPWLMIFTHLMMITDTDMFTFLAEAFKRKHRRQV